MCKYSHFLKYIHTLKLKQVLELYQPRFENLFFLKFTCFNPFLDDMNCRAKIPYSNYIEAKLQLEAFEAIVRSIESDAGHFDDY